MWQVQITVRTTPNMKICISNMACKGKSQVSEIFKLGRNLIATGFVPVQLNIILW